MNDITLPPNWVPDSKYPNTWYRIHAEGWSICIIRLDDTHWHIGLCDPTPDDISEGLAECECSELGAVVCLADWYYDDYCD